MASIELELHVPDFDTVESFYGALGFTLVFRVEEYLVMSLGDATIRFWPGNTKSRNKWFSRFPEDTPRGFGVEVVVSTPDLDAVYSTAKQLNAVVEEMKDKPWGLRDFRAVDPFGFYLRFTEPHDAKSPQNGSSSPA